MGDSCARCPRKATVKTTVKETGPGTEGKRLRVGLSWLKRQSQGKVKTGEKRGPEAPQHFLLVKEGYWWSVG